MMPTTARPHLPKASSPMSGYDLHFNTTIWRVCARVCVLLACCQRGRQTVDDGKVRSHNSAAPSVRAQTDTLNDAGYRSCVPCQCNMLYLSTRALSSRLAESFAAVRVRSGPVRDAHALTTATHLVLLKGA
jgi:hypothetical protein